jgi:hypothetical protein
MKLILIVLFITLPFVSFAQGKGQEKKFKVKIGTKEYPLNEIPEELDLPQRLNRVWIKEDKDKDKDNGKGKNQGKVKNKKAETDEPIYTYTMLVGEEERSFLTDGEYYECKFTHDIKELVCYILDENRTVKGKPFTFKKRK